MNKKQPASADNRPDPRRQLRAAWCRCDHGLEDARYFPNFTCPCGVDKHPYHCTFCMGINQVG